MSLPAYNYSDEVRRNPVTAAHAEGYAAGMEAAAKIVLDRVSLEPDELAAAIRAAATNARPSNSAGDNPGDLT